MTGYHSEYKNYDENGHRYPVLDRLADWAKATEPYTIPLEVNDGTQLALANTARDLVAALIDLTPYSQFQNGEVYELSYKIRVNIRDLTGQFLTNDYTDSNTDEPNDMEWDVCSLVAMIYEDYEVPEDMMPSYVGNIFPGRDDEE